MLDCKHKNRKKKDGELPLFWVELTSLNVYVFIVLEHLFKQNRRRLPSFGISNNFATFSTSNIEPTYATTQQDLTYVLNICIYVVNYHLWAQHYYNLCRSCHFFYFKLIKFSSEETWLNIVECWHLNIVECCL